MSDGSSGFLKIGTTDVNFWQSGKRHVANHLLYTLEETEAISGKYFLRTIIGPTSLRRSRLEMIAKKNYKSSNGYNSDTFVSGN